MMNDKRTNEFCGEFLLNHKNRTKPHFDVAKVRALLHRYTLIQQNDEEIYDFTTSQSNWTVRWMCLCEHKTAKSRWAWYPSLRFIYSVFTLPMCIWRSKKKNELPIDKKDRKKKRSTRLMTWNGWNIRGKIDPINRVLFYSLQNTMSSTQTACNCNSIPQCAHLIVFPH